jgi:hypothetical protein
MPDLAPRRGLGAAAAAPSRGRHRASTAAGSCAVPGEGAPPRIAAPWSTRGGEEGAASAGRERREPPASGREGATGEGWEGVERAAQFERQGRAAQVGREGVAG